MGREFSGPEPVVFPPSEEELRAREYIEARYTPAAIAEKEKAAIEAAERAKLPLPAPTSPGIREIEAKIKLAQELPKIIEKNNKFLESIRANAQVADIT